jgi:uncharacterized membrane protein YbhN (UPF0104 family)
LRPALLLVAVISIIAYLAVQGVAWMYLLDRLGIRAAGRETLLAYAVGNVARYLPGGAYFMNYLLYETSGVDPAVSSVATSLIVLLEPAIALFFLLLIGVDDWVWLRWLIGIGLPLALLFAAGLYLYIESPSLPNWLTDHRRFRQLADEVGHFREGLAKVANRRVLATAVALSAGFVLLEGLGLFLVARALRLDALTLTAAIAAYYFSIGVALIVPIFTNLGTLEASGVGALIALGVSREGAVASMVLDRALIIAVAIVLAVAFGVADQDLLRRALRPKA